MLSKKAQLVRSFFSFYSVMLTRNTNHIRGEDRTNQTESSSSQNPFIQNQSINGSNQNQSEDSLIQDQSVNMSRSNVTNEISETLANTLQTNDLSVNSTDTAVLNSVFMPARENDKSMKSGLAVPPITWANHLMSTGLSLNNISSLVSVCLTMSGLNIRFGIASTQLVNSDGSPVTDHGARKKFPQIHDGSLWHCN